MEGWKTNPLRLQLVWQFWIDIGRAEFGFTRYGAGNQVGTEVAGELGSVCEWVHLAASFEPEMGGRTSARLYAGGTEVAAADLQAACQPLFSTTAEMGLAAEQPDGATAEASLDCTQSIRIGCPRMNCTECFYGQYQGGSCWLLQVAVSGCFISEPCDLTLHCPK